jgi:alpha-tubulin suppressor-like RCC1 family protein
MSRTRTVPVRGATITLWLAGAVLVGASCRDSDLAGPNDPRSVREAESLAITSTTVLAFSQVSAGDRHTCGVATNGQAYCWGNNNSGGLGDGTTFERLTPVPVAGGLRFRQVSAGTDNTCGVTVDFLAYCWGSGDSGALGNGATNDRLTPFAVAGGLQFRLVETNLIHTCGVSYPDNQAYCWGLNDKGQLGDGTRLNRFTPVPVFGSLRFRQVSTGFHHTCGVSTVGQAFCWGWNRYGQLGYGQEVVLRQKPVLVPGGHQFLQLDAGQQHTCGVTTGRQAYCWGNGRSGQNGNGTKLLDFVPTPVSGGFSFDRVTAGAYHTCGETTLNRAYCWGRNEFGELGDGTRAERLRPVAVVGGLFFSQLSAGSFHTCGRTPGAVAYCWGMGGQLGDGSTTSRRRPTPVAGPS